MPTPPEYSPVWHAQQDATERSWLDAWMRGTICPTCLTTHVTVEPATVPALATAGSHR